MKNSMTEPSRREAWLDSKEAFLINEDLGNTLDRVDELVKINDQFKACIGKSVEVEEVYKFAAILGEQDHYEWESIKHRSQCVEERYATLLRKSQDRQKILSDSKNYQLYLTHIIEVSDWMNEKISIALDESCIDPEAKLKEHETFHAEVTANRQRVDAVKTEAEGLIEEGHYQSDNIKKRMGQMEIKWQAFMTASTDKTNRLTKTYQDDVTYNKIVAILLPWIDGLENQLKSEDHGNDLMAVIILLKTHQKLEACISSGKSEVEQLIDGVRKDKYMSKELFARWEVVQDRYGSLIELCYIRQDNLEKALLKP